MVVRSYEELLGLFVKLGVAAQPDNSHHDIALASRGRLPASVVLRWEQKVPFVTVRQTVLEDIPHDRMADITTAVARANHHLPVLGFGIDSQRHALYYRVAVPAFDGVDSDLLNTVSRGVLRTCEEFVDAFQAVVNGRSGVDIEEIYKRGVLADAATAIYDGSF